MSKFKAGDRVRFKEFCINRDEDIRAAEGDYGTITSVSQMFIGIELDEPIIITAEPSKIEVVEPADRKDAFLAELRELLLKYDASIYAHPILAWVDVLLQMDICIGRDVACKIKPCCDLSAETIDNIMDFDKEGA